MLEQCFQVLGEKKLQKMLPDELKVMWCALSGALVVEQRSFTILPLGAFNRCFYPMRIKNIYTPIQTIYTHPHTDGGVNHGKRQPARQEQLGGGALLKDTLTLS